MLIGHEEQVKMFEKIVGNKALSHAYLLSGPSGVGKLNFAQHIVHLLYCDIGFSFADIVSGNCTCKSCSEKNILQHPDVFYTDGSAAISEIRKLRKSLSFSAYCGVRKIAVINSAELLSREAANALLKVLEEPRGDVMFILITSRLALMIPTILSRCDSVKFYYVADEVLSSSLDVSSIEESRTHWNGRPRYAAEILNDQSKRATLASYRTDCFNFMKGGLSERFKISEKYSRLDRPGALHALTIWLELLRDSGSVDNSELLHALLSIHKTLQTTNANLQFALNSLAVNLNVLVNSSTS